jgi:hypothetical protein
MSRLAACTLVVLLTLAAAGTPAGASDADGDGVGNRRDRCPHLAGDRSDGCPTGKWRLRNTNTFGPAHVSFEFGSFAWRPVAGDWNGDGVQSSGLWAPGTNRWRQYEFSTGITTFTFGPGTGTRFPVVGDWDGDGDDTVGVYVPASGIFALRNSNTSGPPDLTVSFGGVRRASAVRPAIGDWDGNGTDTVGLFLRGTRQWRLRNSNTTGGPDLTYTFGPAGSIPVTGDWDGNGTSTPGAVTRAGNLVWRLRNSNTTGNPDLRFGFGARDGTPVVADWDGNGTTTVGVRRP